MSRNHSNTAPGGSSNSFMYTITAVKRWSCDTKHIPATDQIKAIHIFDFDNTLFASPRPNLLLWTQQTIEELTKPDVFANGGWWHDPAILASTGEGIDVEEKRGWKGWWNEHVVDEARKSISRKDVLTVLLSGRSESKFPDLILRIVKSKGLEFDLVCLKPAVTPSNVQVRTTMQYKIEFLKSIVYTYKHAGEITVFAPDLPLLTLVQVK